MPVLLCTNKDTIKFFMMIEVGRTQHALHQDCIVMLNVSVRDSVSVRDRPCTSTVLTSETRLAPGLYSNDERQYQRQTLHQYCTDVRDTPCTRTVQ